MEAGRAVSGHVVGELLPLTTHRACASGSVSRRGEGSSLSAREQRRVAKQERSSHPTSCPLFGLGAGALMLALAIDLAVAAGGRQPGGR